MCSCRLFCLFHCEKALSLMNGAWAHRRIVVYSCFHCVSVCVFQPHACMLLARLWLFYSIFEKVSAILYRTTAAGSNAMHDNIGLNVGFGYPGDTELVTSTHTHTHSFAQNLHPRLGANKAGQHSLQWVFQKPIKQTSWLLSLLAAAALSPLSPDITTSSSRLCKSQDVGCCAKVVYRAQGSHFVWTQICCAKAFKTARGDS